jgi:hypothetical protein
VFATSSALLSVFSDALASICLYYSLHFFTVKTNGIQILTIGAPCFSVLPWIGGTG